MLFVLIVVVLFAVQSPTIMLGEEDEHAATHLDHLAFAVADLESDNTNERALAIGRLAFYRGDSVADGILAGHWFAEPTSGNRLELLRALRRNGTLSGSRVESYRAAATRFSHDQGPARIEELELVLAEEMSPNKRVQADRATPGR